MSQWAEDAIEDACHRAENWYRALPQFPNRVNLGSVVGHKYPAILSEQDCVMNFARFLNDAGVPWDAIHLEVSVSRWLFESPHPAATAGLSERWRVDLAILKSEDFLAATLPATTQGFQFDACLEFAYLSDFYTLPGVHPYGEPAKSQQKVRKDVEKIARYVRGGVCRIGYVIVFEDCDSKFEADFAKAQHDRGCRVRFVRGYPVTSPTGHGT
jgi:hypothetical protein